MKSQDLLFRRFWWNCRILGRTQKLAVGLKSFFQLGTFVPLMARANSPKPVGPKTHSNSGNHPQPGNNERPSIHRGTNVSKQGRAIKNSKQGHYEMLIMNEREMGIEPTTLSLGS